MSRRSSRRYYHGPGALRVFLSSIFVASLPRAAAVASSGSNLTIDDASGANEFYTSPFTNSTIPPDSLDDAIPRWTTQTCGGCPNEPDLEQLQNQTYTALYLPPGNNFTYNISFQFNGTAIYAYLFLSSQAPTTCDFILDGNSTPYEGQTPDYYTYNTLAFSQVGLALKTHQLTIRTSGKPDTANYLGFDYANFTPPSTPSADLTSPNPATPSPSSSGPSGNKHETAKAIAGGVVGGFIAIILLILTSSFYRSRRLRELEKAAHPFLGVSPEVGVPPRHTAEEEHFLMPRPLPEALRSNHNRLDSQTLTRSVASGSSPYDTRPHPFPLPVNPAQSNMDTYARDQVRQQRQREINDRLQAVTTQMRSLKSSYMQDQQRPQNQTQQRTQVLGHGYGGRPPEPDIPVIRLVPGGTPHPVTGRVGGAQPENTGEPMVGPDVLADMRDQMRLMMEQIEYLRAQQNSPYAQGLTDEPPPGYNQVVNWDQLR